MLLLAAMAAWARPAAGQTELENPWRASAYHTFESLSGGRAPWHTVQAMVGRQFDRGALMLEGMASRRFDEWDEAAALDGYLNLGSTGYGNLRVQYAPSPDFLPILDLNAEVYQTIFGSWEASAGYRLRHYDADDFHFFTIGLGLYTGNWYLRGRTTVLPHAGDVGANFALSARRYLNDTALDYVELMAGAGRGVETVDVGRIETTQTYFAGVRMQKFFTPHFGVTVLGSFSDDEFFYRRTVMGGLLARW
jgi:YaiO family outer membrane protein